MKKKDKKKTENNVVPFPNLEQKLLEKGLEYLQNKQFKSAVGLFEEALYLSPDNRDVFIGLLLAYYECGMFEKAKQIAREMLQRGIGDYFDTIELYLMVLVQLNEYEEIATTIDALLEEKEVPREKVEHFTKLLEFSRRMDTENTQEAQKAPLSNEDKKRINLFDNQDTNQLFLTIADLANKNIREYIDDVKEYLSFPEGHPFLKTMLLSILKEQEYEKEILINKFDRQITITPVQLFDISEHPQKFEIEKELQKKLESENPVLYGQVKDLLERQMFLLYPFDFIPENFSLWAGAYHAIGLEFNGGNCDLEYIAFLYKIDPEKIQDAYYFIKKLEKISYPII